MTAGVVIVGGGQGGFQVAASLREEGYAGPVTIVAEEADPPYQRPPLSKGFLLGKTPAEQLALRPAAFYGERAIELLPQTRVQAIDRAARRVQLSTGAWLAYEHLVLATGARARMPRIPGVQLQDVLALRTQVDARQLLQSLGRARRVVIVGAGFIGLEVAVVARELGLHVDVLEFADRAMLRSVSPEVANYLSDALAQRGVQFHFGTAAEAFEGDTQVRRVVTNRGTAFDADLVVVGMGVEPEDALARDAGLAVGNGIVVDAQLCTGDPDISAIGDCARFPARYCDQPLRLESVQNAVDQARCVAARIAGKPAAYDKVPWFWSDQGPNRLQIAGVAQAGDSAVMRGTLAEGKFSVLRFRGGRLTAVESVNSAADHMAARKLLAAGVALTPEQAADASVKLASLAS
ncbi:MAG TPA: FAD-dependent oxidoreductase [Ramlibacter sp.]|nr:FAD-dependent oxidoreductase [Ramlibacter sp.]